MKKTILILTFLFGSLSLLAQEPVIKFYLLDGSTKQYNISDIENIKLGNESGNSTMKIYYQDSLKEEFASKSIDKILFEVNTSNILLLSIYVSNIPHQFILSEIDSISYVSIPVLHITNVFPSSGEIGDEITITGTCFGSAEGTSVVSFNGTNVSDYTSWSDKEIKVKVPTGASSGKISVTVNSTKSNEVDFTVLAPNQPQIISINPSSASIGDIVTITGRNFSNTQGSSYFTFNGKNATDYPSWSETEIKVKIPTGSSSGKTSVTVNGTKSNEVDFAIIPNIANANPQAGRIGDTITISGSGFGSTPGSSIVSFNGKNASEFINWNTTQIKVKVPQGAETGKLSVTASGQKSNEIDFVIIPSILNINPTSARIGDTVTISGTGFGSSRGTGIVSFNQKDAIDYISWNDTEIKVIVPQGAETGKVSVTASGKKSNEIDFAVIPYITEITPNSGKTGEIITISGTGFGSTKYSSSFVAFYSQNAIDYISWSSTEIKVKVPEKAESGTLYVMVNGIQSNNVDFNIIPNIINIKPSVVKLGDEITIYGTGFGISQSNGIVSFNGTNANEIVSWVITKINVKVPQEAETGNLSIIVNGMKSNEVVFFIKPYISSISPTSSKVGELITINGTSFGSNRGSSFVRFKGQNPSSGDYITWNSTQITVKVPQEAETGNIYVSVGDLNSNEVNFSVIPYISSINPTSAKYCDTLTISGTGFSTLRNDSKVTFNGTDEMNYLSWSNTLIKVKVPTKAKTGKIFVTANSIKSNEVDFIVSDISSSFEEVIIGTQIWMKKNLDVNFYCNCDPIPEVTDPSEWSNLTSGAWCYYDNSSYLGAIYGKLYNWDAVGDSRGLAPAGWHIPSMTEWETLSNFLGGDDVAGRKLREVGNEHWNYVDTTATNESGFTALPAGTRYDTGEFNALRVVAIWHSTTSYLGRFMNGTSIFAINGNYAKHGFSVRCIKD